MRKVTRGEESGLSGAREPNILTTDRAASGDRALGDYQASKVVGANHAQTDGSK
jgi:hypothetical protein